MTEKEVEKILTDRVKAAGGQSYKFVSPGASGVPDRIVIMPGGRVYFVELKTEVGKLSALQSYRINQLQKLGCDVRVLYGLRMVEDFIHDIKGGGDK